MTVKNKMPSSTKSCCTYISQRWVFAILACAGLCMQSIFSVMMSMTIIEMVVRTETINIEDSKSCPSAQNTSLTNQKFLTSQIEDVVPIERYHWDEYTQGIILSSFAWSCMIATFFHGTLAERFGGKTILGFAIFAQAVITFITPFVINRGGCTALIITRVIIGLASDGMYPVVSTMIPHWSTPEERTKIGNVVYAGSVLGLFFGTVMPALIIKYSDMGWPAVFYFVGIMGIIWFPLWHLYVYDHPDEHPFISDEEFDHLKSTLHVEKVHRKLPPAPWKQILTCNVFWVFTLSYIGCNCAYYIMLSGLPRYMANVVKFPIETNGYFSSLPYIFMWLNSLVSGWINDKILEKQVMSLTNIRKLLTTVSVTGPGIFLLLASYSECDKTMVVIMFIVGITMIGSVFSSLMMNPMDLSTNYAGSVMSAASGISQSVAILSPYLIGVLVPNSTITEWRFVFWMVLSIECFANVVYLRWFKADVQPWNEVDFGRNEIKDTKNNEVELKLMS